MSIFNTGVQKVTSLIGSFRISVDTGGPLSAVLPLKGGTFVANGASGVAVAESWIVAWKEPQHKEADVGCVGRWLLSPTKEGLRK